MLFFHLGYQVQQILRASFLGDIVFLKHYFNNLAQRSLLLEQLPDSGPDWIEPQIHTSLQVQENRFALEFLKQHVILDSYTRIEINSRRHIGCALLSMQAFTVKNQHGYVAIEIFRCSRQNFALTLQPGMGAEPEFRVKGDSDMYTSGMSVPDQESLRSERLNETGGAWNITAGESDRPPNLF
jgi:hypothetical protein